MGTFIMTSSGSYIQANTREVILRSMIAKGGQGTIFSARNVVDDTALAVKTVDISTLMRKINFRAEKETVQIIRPWKLDYLCDIYEYVEIDDIGYILMKRYNCDLLDVVQENKCISEDLGRIYFRKIVKGLMNLHSIGVAHLDIKLENIMMDFSNNSPYIGDFGSCYVFKNNGNCNFMRGTRKYYPPEYAKTKAFNPVKTDIFCLGVTLHAMLTGYFPYDSQLPPDERGIRLSGKLSPECKDLLFKMLKRDPKKRISLKKVTKHPWVKLPTDNKGIRSRVRGILHF